MKQKRQEKVLSEQALELVAARFRLLGEPVRLKLLMCLQHGPKTVTQLVEETNLTQPNVSRHVAKLADGGVLSRQKNGLNVFYGISDTAVFDLCDGVCGTLRRNLEEKGKAFKA